MASNEQLNTKELEKMVRAYGGVVAALEHGVRSEQIADPEFAWVWRRLEQQYAELRPNVSVASRILKAARAP